jgi:hypothetical protein
MQEGSRGEGDAGTSYMLHERSSQLRHVNQAAHTSFDRLHERGTYSEGIEFIYPYHPRGYVRYVF